MEPFIIHTGGKSGSLHLALETEPVIVFLMGKAWSPIETHNWQPCPEKSDSDREYTNKKKMTAVEVPNSMLVAQPQKN